MYIFFLSTRQGPKIAGVVLHRVGIFGFFCPKQGQGLRPSAANLYPNIGQVPPPGSLGVYNQARQCLKEELLLVVEITEMYSLQYSIESEDSIGK